MNISIKGLFKSFSPAKSIKIDKMNLRKAMVFSESLNKECIITSAINLLSLLIKGLKEEYELYFLIPEGNGLFFNIKYLKELLDNSDALGCGLDAHVEVEVKNNKLMEDLKKYIKTQSSAVISEDFIINLALMIYIEFLQYIKREGYEAYLVPVADSNKSAIRILV